MNWEYLAGFTDGDGYITRTFVEESKERNRRANYQMQVGWVQKVTGATVLFEIRKFLEQHGCTVSMRFQNKRGGEMVDIHVAAIPSIKFVLESLLPHLIVKRKRAVECLWLINNRGGPTGRYTHGRNAHRDWPTEEQLKQAMESECGGWRKSVVNCRALDFGEWLGLAISCGLQPPLHFVLRAASWT